MKCARVPLEKQPARSVSKSLVRARYAVDNGAVTPAPCNVLYVSAHIDASCRGAECPYRRAMAPLASERWFSQMPQCMALGMEVAIINTAMAPETDCLLTMARLAEVAKHLQAPTLAKLMVRR